MEVIKERVSIDEQSGHARINEGAPPPSVVFPRQLEVEQCHTNEGGDNDKEDEGKEQDSEKGVNLMSPHGRKDVMELNVNCREGQESRNDHLEETATVPGHLGGDLTCHLGSAGGGIEVMARIILGGNPSQDSQGEGNQRKDGSDRKNRREGQRTRGAMKQRDGIHPHKDNKYGGGEESRSEKDATHPRLAVHLEVKPRGHEAADGTRQTVEDDQCRQDGPATRRGNEASQRQSEEEEGCHNELYARSD